jgi:tetratricopeptide (TPR) repeat protein
MGKLYHLLEKHDKAAEQFARVLDALKSPEKIPLDSDAQKTLLGEPGPTYNLIGESFLLAGRLEDAAAVFQKADQVAPNKGLLGYHLARVEARRKNPEKALTQLQAYFDRHVAGEGVGPYRLLAEILKDLHKENELIQRLEKLRAADPQNAPLGYFLAEQYRQAQQADKAEALYLSLVEKSPTLTGFRSLVEIYRKSKRPELLLKVLGQAIAKTASLEPLGAEGRAVSGDKSLVQTLIETARRQVKADPAHFGYDARVAVALLAMDAKEYDAAGEFFNLAIQAKADQAAELLLTWGLGLLMAEKHAQAADVFQRAIDQKVKPREEPVFYFYLAGALEMAGRTDQALAAARKAAGMKKSVPRFLARVGWVLYHAKRYEEAAKVYSQLLEKSGSDQTSAEVRQVIREGRLIQSNLCVLTDKLPQAEEWLEQVLDEFPDDLSALNDLGYLWADANKHLVRAERMIREAVEGEPENAAYRDSLGWVLYRLGRFPEAVAELEKAVAGEPDPVVLDHLGDAYLAAKQPDKAKGLWQRAVEAFNKQGKPDKAKPVQEKVNRQR